MQRRYFDGRNGIFEDAFVKSSGNVISAINLIDVTKSFLLAHYDGIFRITAEIEAYEFVKLTEVYIAKLFKHIVDHSELNKLVNVNLCCDITQFSIKIFYNDGTRFEKDFERELTRLARNSSLEAYRLDEGLFLCKRVYRARPFAVYTNIAERMRLESIFREVFFGNEE